MQQRSQLWGSAHGFYNNPCCYNDDDVTCTVAQRLNLSLCQQVGALEADRPDGGGGDDGGFGNLPSSGPLPPHLVVKIEKGKQWDHVKMM